MATIEQFLAGETTEFGPSAPDQPEQRWPVTPRPRPSWSPPRTPLFNKRDLLIGTVLSVVSFVCCAALALAFRGMLG